MGTLDKSTGSQVTKKIEFLNVTGQTPNQIEAAYNNNYGKKGWSVIQYIEVGSQRYLLGEKEITE